MKPLYMVGGSKGGVGKTMICMSLLDYMRARSEDVLLIETDTSNPDVAKAYGDVVKTETINLDERDGWLVMLDALDAHRSATVVINSAARSNMSVMRYGATLNSSLAELKRKMITLWVINRQRDSLELLRDYMHVMTHSRTHVVRNAYWGADDKYELYNNSKTRTSVEDAGGLTLTFPDLADRVADELYSKRLRIEDAQKILTIGNRAELQRWCSECKVLFDEVTK